MRFPAVLSRPPSVKPGYDFIRLLLAGNPTWFDKLLLGVGTVSAVGAGLPFPLLSLLYGELMNDLNTSCGDPDPEQLYAAILRKVFYIIGIGIANFFLIYTYMGCWTLLGERLAYRIRYAYLKSLLRQDLTYFDNTPSGEVASSLEADMRTIQDGTSEKVSIYITSLSYFITAYVVAYTLDAQLTVLLSVLVPAYFAMTMIGNHFTTKYTSKVNTGVNAAVSIASECLSNISVVQAFGASSRFEGMFANELRSVRSAAVGKFVTAATQLGTLYFIAYATKALAVWQGSKHIADALALQNRDFNFGNIYAVILLLIDASFVFTRVAPFLTIFATATERYQKLSQVMQRASKIDGVDTERGILLNDVKGELSFENVSFHYPSRPDVLVLDKLSLTIPAHKMTAIVGLSGSGKSTTASLITRLYDPDDGQVLLDGHDIKSLNTRFLRNNIAIVEQEPSLMDVSILENVAYGICGLDDKDLELNHGALSELVQKVRSGIEIELAVAESPSLRDIVDRANRALAKAGATVFVEDLEFGIATKVGPKGRQLSGGQRQRIAVARALIRDAPIIVLDEATAALDSKTESFIQTTLEQECKGKTILFIAHRLSTIKNADKIIVMKSGKVLEEGSYLELIRKNGDFANLVRHQSLEAALMPDTPALSNSNASSASVVQRALLDESEFSEKELEPCETTTLLGGRLGGNYHNGKRGKWDSVGVFRKVLGLAQPQRLYILLGVVAAFVVGMSHTLEATLMGGSVDKINICHTESFIRRSGIQFACLFFLAGIVELVANVASSSAFGWVSEILLFKTRVLSFRSLLRQDIEWHESKGRTPNTLLSYISTDTASLSSMTGSVLGISFGVVVSLLAGIIISHVVAWRIAIVLLATVPFLLGSGYLRLQVLSKFQEKHQQAFATSVDVAKEAVDSISMIAAYGLEGESLESYRRSLKEPYEATMRTVMYGNFWLALAYSISNVIYGLAYWWGAKQILAGYYTQAQFFIVLPALLVGAQGCGQLFSMAPDISRAGVAAERVLSLISLLPKWMRQSTEEEEEEYTRQSSLPIKGGIGVSFNNVRFSYPSRPNIEVLKGLDIDIPPGKFCALVGPSGSGKSTVLALMERFYRPSSGTIKIGGREISRTSRFDFRDDIALVPQSSMLFDGTVSFNLNLGSRPGTNAGSDQIEAAARKAHIHDMISSLPEGYNTSCGTNGGRFSGGQRQRLAIARALVRNPRLLLLDEPTSALDAESERRWQEALEEISNNMTIVAIAHRLHTIRKADIIFLIEDGKCVDKGTHEELFARSETYRTNVLHQTLDS